YINEFSIRIELYHRMGEAIQPEDLREILDEIKDRFGPPPPPVVWLYHMNRIRAFAAANHFSALKFDQGTLFVEKQKGKEVEKKSIPLPKEIISPDSLEIYVIQVLKDFDAKIHKIV
ncbi:MAG: transcription-repair coupling factor, partial [Chlamydiia bacterium]|nr:transcription-repair coupling factor [Chlamydiia bacterium]